MVRRKDTIPAGVCRALFIGYCIYFDRKRQSDPNFKNRLRERRKKQKLTKERVGLSKLPDLKNAEAVQFFLEEIQLGEELLNKTINQIIVAFTNFQGMNAHTKNFTISSPKT